MVGGRPLVNLTDKRINMLLVLGPAAKHADHPKRTYWRCRCDCGVVKDIHQPLLRRPRLVKSCGCAQHRLTSEALWRGHGEISSSFWTALRHSASARGLSLKITIEQAWKLFLKQQRRCGLTGLVLTFAPTRRRRAERTASIDRIDSNYGYTINNVMWVHKDINMLKKRFSNDKLIYLATLIAKHAKRRQTLRKLSKSS